jgi:hypothetical protein
MGITKTPFSPKLYYFTKKAGVHGLNALQYALQHIATYTETLKASLLFISPEMLM